jgi:predicted outer membrane repeat protein
MRKRLLGFCALALTGAAYGQSFNIDFNIATGAGAGVPSTAYRGAAGQAGHWNSVSDASATLNNLTNNPTPVTMSRSGSGTIVNVSTAVLSGDDEKLLEDVFRGSIGSQVSLTFNNLESGHYAVYTYAIHPDSTQTCLVNVWGSTSLSNQLVGTMLYQPGFSVGATHSLHVVEVTNGTLFINFAPSSSDFQVHIGGLQLVKLNGPRLRIYVDDGGPANGAGASWSDAMPNLQTALTNARYAGGRNTEIWVANGTYRPTTTNLRHLSFDVPNGLHLIGGFWGTETGKDQRGIMLTYLNGNIGGSGAGDNSFTVLDASLTDNTTLIDGFRIHNGYNDNGGPGDAGRGGGLRLQGSSAVLRNCTFVSNYAGDAGGAVYSDGGSPTFIDCTFYQNEAYAGSAVFHSGNGMLRMYNCEFLGNDGYIGTVALNQADALIFGGYFHGNYVGGQGGCLYAVGSGSLVNLVNCTLSNNDAGQDAGGVFALAGATINVRNSILWGNASGLGQTLRDQQYVASGFTSSVNVTNTTVQGAAGTDGLNPLFVDANGPDNIDGTFDDNCRLQAGSPALNSGNNNLLPTDDADIDDDGDLSEKVPYDFDGGLRIRAGVVDRGAFERVAGAGLGDMNCDGVLSVGDIGPFVMALTNPSGYVAAFPNCDIGNGDIDGNGAVSVGDN